MLGYSRKNNIFAQTMYSLFERNCTEDFPGETHDFWEMMYVLDGKITVTADNRIYNLDKNCIILHKPMEFHKFIVKPNDGTRIFVASFDLSGDMTERLEKLTARLTPEQQAAFEHLYIYCTDNYADYNRDTAYNDFCIAAEQSPIFSQTVFSFIDIFLLTLCDSKKKSLDKLKNADSRLFSSVLKEMRENEDEFLTIDELALRCSTSSSKLKNLFYKYTGYSVHKYYLNLKILRAKELLGKGVSIGDVSHMLGFCNQNYFSSVFKRETGLSPSEYIKSL